MSTNVPITNKRGSVDFPLQALDKTGLVQRAFDWLFGYDYFLAHRSADGKTYASALYDALTAKGNELDCFLDVKHYGAGGSLTRMQARALCKTSRLIVVVTPQAHDTDAFYLQSEVSEFRRIHSGGIIVPIGTTETLAEMHCPRSPLLPLLPHLPNDICILESAERLREGTPSTQTVAKLLNDFSEERRSTKRLRWIRSFAALLLVLLIAATGFGIYAGLQRSKAESAMDSAEQALTASFFRTIGTSVEAKPSTDEREALWELAELASANQNVKTELLKSWGQSADSVVRATRYRSRGLHAAIGLNSHLELNFNVRVNDAAEFLSKELETMQETDYHLALSLGNALATLAMRMNSTNAARFANRLASALENADLPFSRRSSSLAIALPALISRMDLTDAEPIAKSCATLLAEAMLTSQDRNKRPIAEGLGALVAEMIPSDAMLLGDSIAEAVESDQVRFRNPGLKKSPATVFSLQQGNWVETNYVNAGPSEWGKALADIAARMDPSIASPLATRGAVLLVDRMVRAAPTASYDFYYSPLNWGDHLAVLAATISSNDAALLGDRVVMALETSREPDSSRPTSLAKMLAALAERMNPADAGRLAERLVKAMEISQDPDSSHPASLAKALAALAVQINPGVATPLLTRGSVVLTRALENPYERTSGRFSSLAEGLAAVVAPMGPASAALVARRLVLAMENTQKSDASRRSSLARALVATAVRINADEAAPLAARLVEVLEDHRESDSFRLNSTALALGALAARMKPTEAAPLVLRGAEALAEPTVNPQRSEMPSADALAALLSQMTSTDAAALAARLANALEKMQVEKMQGVDFYRASIVANALATLAARLSPLDRAALAARGTVALAKILENPQRIEGSQLRIMVFGLAALAAQMNSLDAVPVAGHLAKAFENPQETEFYRLKSVAAGLAALSARIPSAHQTRLMALSFLVTDGLPDPEAEDANGERTRVEGIFRSQTAEELVEVLKWPFCVGEAQKLVLAELEKKLEKKLNPPQKFDGDLWKFVKFVEQNPKLGFSREFLDAPAKRPQITNAIAELKAIQASYAVAQKPTQKTVDDSKVNHK